MLDRAGHSAIKRQQIESVSTTLTKDELAEMRAAREARKRKPAVDVPGAETEVTLDEVILEEL